MTGSDTDVREIHPTRSLTRHTAYYLIGRIATGLVGLGTLVAFTRVLSPEDYGRYAVIIAIGSLISAVGFQWLRQCLVRFATGVKSERQPLLGTLGATFGGLLLAMIVVAFVLAIPQLNRLLHAKFNGAELAVICFLAAAVSWFELSIDAARTEFRPWRYGAATLTRACLSLSLGVIAALLTHQVLLVVLATGIAYLLAFPLAAPRWLTGLLRVRTAEWAEARRLAGYGLPLAATLGMAFILDSSDRLMLAGMRGYTEAGVYSSAYNLAQFSIGTVLMGLGLGSLPLAVGTFQRLDKPGTARLLGNNLVLGVGIGLPAVVGLVMLAPGLDRILLGNNVIGRSDIVTMIVAVAMGLGAIRSYCVDIVFMLHRRTWMQALIIGVSALLNVLLNLILIPRWGSAGAAFASLVAFLSAFIGSWFLSRQYLKIPVALKDIAKILVSCAVMALVLSAISPNTGHWPKMLLGIAAGVAIYFVVALALDIAGSRARLGAWFANRNAGS